MASKKLPPTTTKRCGTNAGYQAHYKRGETPCGQCKAARQAYNRRDADPRKPREVVTVARVTEDTPIVPQDPDPSSDRDATGGVTAAPKYLRERGRALWDAVLGEFQLSPAARVSLAEACRIADRLERMAAALSSNTTVWFELSDEDRDRAEDGGVPIVVNGMIGEARQLSNQYQAIMRNLGLLDVTVVQEETKSVADQLAERRRERLAREQGA